MNKCEKEMLSILKMLREKYGALAVKAEFEAEGTRTDELLRLIYLARSAELNVGLKIGGCEAVRDLIESKQFGVEYIVAPMVETPYALKKFIDAKNKVYTKEQQQDTDFLFNLETIASFNALDDLVKIANCENGVGGVVFGRVDFVGSNNMARGDIDAEAVTQYVVKAGEACRQNGLDFVVGGAVSIDSLVELHKIKATHLTRFETRKVIFAADALDLPDFKKGLEETVHFELLWLKNKRDFYNAIKHEDNDRIAMLESRWNQIRAN
jgi:hypothetical protein